MTEAILVAIIGISGTVLASSVGSLFLFLNTRSQNSHRTNELQQQFEHERKETQVERLIKRRASYLEPISKELQSITESTHHLESKIHDLIFLAGFLEDDHRVVWSESASNNCMQSIAHYEKEISLCMDKIEMLRTQNTDGKLQSLIHKTLTSGIQFSKMVTELRNIRIKHGEGDTGNDPNKEVSNECTGIMNSINEFFANIRESNKRIEEILSGMD